MKNMYPASIGVELMNFTARFRARVYISAMHIAMEFRESENDTSQISHNQSVLDERNGRAVCNNLAENAEGQQSEDTGWHVERIRATRRSPQSAEGLSSDRVHLYPASPTVRREVNWSESEKESRVVGEGIDVDRVGGRERDRGSLTTRLPGARPTEMPKRRHGLREGEREGCFAGP